MNTTSTAKYEVTALEINALNSAVTAHRTSDIAALDAYAGFAHVVARHMLDQKLDKLPRHVSASYISWLEGNGVSKSKATRYVNRSVHWTSNGHKREITGFVAKAAASAAKAKEALVSHGFKQAGDIDKSYDISKGTNSPKTKAQAKKAHALAAAKHLKELTPREIAILLREIKALEGVVAMATKIKK